MEFNRTKNSTKTVFFGLIYKIITIIGPFLTRTIIIYILGSDYLGLSSLFTSVLSILNISELGIGSAIAFCLYKPVAENDRRTVNGLLSLLRKLYKYIGGFILLIGILLTPFLKYLIHGEAPAELNISVLYIIYLLNACVSYLGFAYKSVLFNVYQRGDVTHRIEAFAEIIKYTFQIIVLLLFRNYYYFALMLPISTILITIVTQIRSKKYFPDLIPEGEIDEELKAIIKKKVLYLSAHSIAAKLTNSVDSIVISSEIGLSANGLYGNYSYISTSVLGLLLIAYNALTPAIGNSLVSENDEKNSQLFNGLSFLCFWAITFCSASLLCLYEPFMSIWVGEGRLLGITVVIVVTLFFYSNASRQLLTTYVGAAGLWEKTLARQIIAAVVNLILDLILVKDYGIAGIVFASFITNAAIALPMDIYVTYKYILHDTIKNGVLKTLKWFVFSGCICIITYYVCSLISSTGYIGFLLKALICLLIPNLLVISAFHRSSDFVYIRSHFTNLLAKHR